MITIGKYQVLKKLGSGGFGQVYLAEDPAINRKVAIKVFQPKDENLAAYVASDSSEGINKLAERFVNEAKILASLEHDDAVVNIIEFGTTEDGQPWYSMPYLPHSLADKLGKDIFDKRALEDLPASDHPRALATGDALDYLSQILQGLAAAHHKGLIHRDIKPANILLTDSNKIRIADFGIAKAPDSGNSTVSQLGMGSRNYMAPEQRESAKHVDARADIYSLGVLAYRMLTGQLPKGRFADPNVHVTALSQQVNDVILNAIQEDAEGRYTDAADMLKAYNTALQLQGDVTRGPDSTEPQDETGTWIEAGKADIRPELKPLKSMILQALEKQGEVQESDRVTLKAMASVAGLSEGDLTAFIDVTTKAYKQQSPENTAWLNWVESVNQTQQQDGNANKKVKLTQPEIEALLTAGGATGRNQEQLLSLLQIKGIKTGKQSRKKGESSGSAQQTRQQAAQSSGSAGKWLGIILVLMFLGGGGYYGYEQYQLKQEQARQAEVAKRNEQSAWQQAQSLNSIAGYDLYLQSWPEGKNAQTAQTRKADLLDQARLATLSAAQQQAERIKQAQQKFITLGYSLTANGTLDIRTKRTIEDFEEKEGLIVTGEVDNTLLVNLDKVIDREDTAAFDKAKSQNTIAGFEQYISDKPWGEYHAQAKENIAQLKEAARLAKAKALARQQDNNAWQQATTKNSLIAYQSYLTNQAQGQYRSEAKTRIAAIELENSKVALSINVTPADAKVEILNIKEVYQPGMRLEPGEYQVRLSKDWFKPQQQTITLSSENKQFEYQLEDARPDDSTYRIKGVLFVLKGIPGGSFMMGSNNVTIRPFRLMATEVTWAMYQPCIDAGVCTDNQDKGGDEGWGKGNRPVINVSWNNITQEYIPWLNAQTGQSFRLPTEAEWEYAARAGSTTKYSWGDSISCSQARYGRRSGGECSDSQDGTVAIKSFAPNEFGLYDMHGNVWEWVQDCYNDSYNGAPGNGSAWMQGDCGRAVLRGGSWGDIPLYLRSATRLRGNRKGHGSVDGFRLAQGE